MNDTGVLEGKKLLVVDDEPDVLETIKELLDMCQIETAADFRTAEKLLNRNQYDIAVLDIMGVNGYELLKIANEKGVPALMLTAHALSPDNFAKSISEGAKAYIPKEKLADIASYLSDLLKAREGTEKPNKWFSRLKPYFSVQFGKDWLKDYHELKKELEKKFGSVDWV